MFLRWSVVVSLFVALLGIHPALIAQKDKEEEVKPTTVIKELREEGKTQFKNGVFQVLNTKFSTDPRSKAFEKDDVFRYLGRRIDSNPAVDAFVKIKLLSLLSVSDMNGANGKQLKGMVDGFPKFQPWPKMPKSLSSPINGLKAQDVTRVKPENVKRAEKAWEIYVNGKDFKNRELTNKVISDYGKALEKVMPKKSVYLSYYRMVHCMNKIAAGLFQKKDLNGETGKPFAKMFTGLKTAKDLDSRTASLIIATGKQLSRANGRRFIRPKKGKERWESGMEILTVGNPKALMNNVYYNLGMEPK